MRNMKKQLINSRRKLIYKLANTICEVSITIGEKSIGKCTFFGAYEPKIPIELLKSQNK